MPDKIQKYLPPEWVEQKFVQLTWPHEDTDWAEMIDEVSACFARIVVEISKREKVLIVCQNGNEVLNWIKKGNLKNITLFETELNDTWARDHGGITVFENERPVIYDFTFNGWGLKFAADFDNQITGQMYRNNIFPKTTGYRNCLNFILEGGSIESDGEGTLLTTAECLLSLNRNSLSKSKIEDRLIRYFGLKRVLWLNYGYLEGDDTDSHVDTLARFCSPQSIAYVKCDDEKDVHYEELKKMEEELVSFTTIEGNPYQLIPLPMADPVYVFEDRLPATYANFLIINGAVLVPTYNSPKDEIAQNQLQMAFPDREIVGIDCTALIKQHGSLHCVTMQYPASPLNPEGE